jgi:putative ABC transport system permease protein
MSLGRSWRPWRRVFPPHPDHEVDEELQFHMDQRIRDYVAKGMSPEAARAAATERLGDIAGIQRACTSLLAAERAAEGRRVMFRVSWLDVKLGVRMFARYPGLSLVSVIGMAVAIAIGTGYYAAARTMMDSTLPFDPEGRVVVIRTRVLAGQPGLGAGASMHDFEHWRSELKSFSDIGAFREDSRNLIKEDGQAHLVTVATVTASAFPLTGVAPLLGRTLLAEDERPGAPPVLVIAHDEWQRRFNGDPRILGRTVRLDEATHTIVGVMPHGFEFPINHRYWVPLRPAEFDRSARAATSVNVFGRIAAASSLEQARAEVAALGERMAAALPDTHRDVRPQVQSFTHTFVGTEGPEAELAVRGLQFGISLLLFVVAVNVSILVYARTATRTGEIAVRTALGASRVRVVWQLFVEALVPALTATAIGLGLVAVAFRLFRGYIRNSFDRIPYWITPESFSVSPDAVLYSLALATVAAVVIGVLPALKATGRRVQAGLQQFSARGAGLQLGRVWTALIVLQVAIAVAALPAALYNAEAGYRVGMRQPSPAAAPLLRATVTMSAGEAAISGNDAAGRAQAALFAARMTALIERLKDEPGVAAVTYAHRFPGDEQFLTYEVEAGAQPITFRAGVNRVAANLFDVLDVRVLAGRGFTNAEPRPGAPVIVDQAFAGRLGGTVLGRRVRPLFPSRDGSVERGPWHEIVGVVPSFAEAIAPPLGTGPPTPRLYLAAMPGDNLPATLIVKVSGGEPTRLTERLRAISASVDSTLKLETLIGVVQEFDHARKAFWYVSLGILAVTASVLLLSAAGIYALMSFTVARRRREIGIRAALGADARRVLIGIFGRAAAQIGAGIAAGLALAAALAQFGGDGGPLMGGRMQVLLPIVAGLMFLVGILAALGPARRGLAVQPSEALREE